MSISTARLVLRPVESPEARRIVDQTPAGSDNWADGFPREDDVDGLRAHVNAGSPTAFGNMLITDKATGAVIGTIGFYGPPDEQGQVTIGYGLVEQYRGKGLGTEALAALVGYCRERPEVKVILADTDVENKVSQHVLEKTGFTFLQANTELCFYQLDL
jgi:RimJ/RimL family protein N-acetyltransferase